MTYSYPKALHEFSSNKELAVYRLNIVKYALSKGISDAARYYDTSRVTVRKWVRRWKESGVEGLEDQRHGPLEQPNRIPKEDEELIRQFRVQHPHMGARRIRIELKLPYDQKTIHRVLKEAHLLTKHRSKYRKKQDLRAIKMAKYDPGECWQVDVKYLTDIPSAVEIQVEDSAAPRFMYSMKDVHSGAVFLGYAKELSESHAQHFVHHILSALRSHGLSPENTIIQTDNGSEFSGARYVLWDREGFSHTVHVLHGAEHRFIPPGCSNANADVESFHNTIEREFFNIMRFESAAHMIASMTAFQSHFNNARYCLSKGGKTPLQFMEKTLGQAAIHLLSLPPVDLDALVYANQRAATKDSNYASQTGKDLTPLTGPAGFLQPYAVEEADTSHGRRGDASRSRGDPLPVR